MTQSHCAKFSPQLWPTIAGFAFTANFRSQGPREVWDPMAGVGTLEDILAMSLLENVTPVGSEIEGEYAAERPWIRHEDCRDHAGSGYRLIVTSPPYANRMADQYLGTPAEVAEREATGKKPRRASYAIDLGRPVTHGSAGQFAWGEKYRDTMTDVWKAVVTRLDSCGGVLVVNVASSFYTRAKKKGEGSEVDRLTYAPVAEWTLETILNSVPFIDLIDAKFVETPGMRDGENRQVRVGGEMVYCFRKNES